MKYFSKTIGKLSAVSLSFLFMSGCLGKTYIHIEDTTPAAYEETSITETFASETEISEASEALTEEIISETAETSAESSDPAQSSAAASSITENSSAESAAEHHELPEDSAERLLMIFSSADYSTGFLGDSMKEVLGGMHEDIPIKKLTEANVIKTIDNGMTDKVLFAFSINRSNGLIPIKTGGRTYYASGFTSESGERYTAVFGSSEFTSPREAAKYINTCGRADYIAFCKETENGTILMPIAAGTSQDGIYTVIPNAAMMGYDMSGTEPFRGISDSVSIYITDSNYNEKEHTLSLYYETYNSFLRSVYFRCDDLFINGEPIPEEYYNEFPFTLYDKGTIRLSVPEPSDGDIYFFSGKICEHETDEEICQAGLTAFDIRA